jgi:hypothetical protein
VPCIRKFRISFLDISVIIITILKLFLSYKVL